MATVHILIADDYPALRTILARALQMQASLEVVGEAADGYSAVLLADKLRPDVVLMDINMPGLNGIEATRRIVERNPGVKVIGLSVHCFEFYARKMLEAGARGYLLKDGDLDELLEAIETVCGGGTYVSPEIISLGGRAERRKRSWRFLHAG